MLTLAIIAKHGMRSFRALVDSALPHVSEVLVALDDGADPGMLDYRSRDRVRYWQRPLARDFSAQRNFLCEQVHTDWVIHLDTDENLCRELWFSLAQVLQEQPATVDVLQLPRANYMRGVSKHESDWINWPDWQPKLHRRHIRWARPVHEWPVDFREMRQLPATLFYAIRHNKTVEQQAVANQLYKDILEAQPNTN